MFLHVLMVKAMGNSWEEETPMVVGAVAALEEATDSLGFGEILIVKSLKRLEKAQSFISSKKA